MHYIRFLKPPQISAGVLTAKLTITSDLGDDFLAADLPLNLIFQHSATDTIIGNPNIMQWKAGSRELKISIPLPRKGDVPKDRDGGWQLLVWPRLTGVSGKEGSTPGPAKHKKGKPIQTLASKPSYSGTDYLLNMEDVLSINRGISKKYAGVKGLVLPAKSTMFTLGGPEQRLPASVERTFGMDFWNGEDGEFKLVIEEETGNSIARHVWDAGVVLSALLREMCVLPDEDAKKAPITYLPELWRLLQSGHGDDEKDDGSTSDGEDDDILAEYGKALNVLELGTGCAIVSATLSHCLPYVRLVATDMPEATEIAIRNLERNRTEEIARGDLEMADSGFEVLDWTKPLPQAKDINTCRWNLVLVADCTYNADVVPALVQTLRSLVNKSPEVLIAVALKWRHDSEAIFHELMKENGMRQVDKHTERCGNFDEDATGKEEEIEVYLFRGGESNDSKGKKDNGEEQSQNDGARKRKLSETKEEGPAKN